MSEKYRFSSDEMSRKFGGENSLKTKGGLFDQIDVGEADSEEYEAPNKTDDAELSKPTDQADSQHVGSSGKNEKNSGRKGLNVLKTVAVAALLVTVAAVVFSVFFFRSHAVFGDLFDNPVIASSNSLKIDLSGSDFDDYSQISKLKSVEEINLTNTPVDDLSVLYECKTLKKVILADRVLKAEDCLEFYTRLPDARLVCRIDLDGDVYDSEVTEITENNANDYKQELFASLRNLKTLDLTGCTVTDNTMRSLLHSLPECRIIINVEIGGRKYRTDAQSIVLAGEIKPEDADRIDYFRDLIVIDAKDCTSSDLVTKIMEAHPEVRYNQPIEILGRQFFTEDEVIDLRGNKYTYDEVRSALDEAVPQMRSLSKIDLCACGLDNSEMEKLCSAYPDIKLVWMLYPAKGRWQVRTDAVAFSTLTDKRDIGKTYTEKDFEDIFKYCTDLVAIDLGHTRVHDMTLLANDKKLRAVIFTDTAINDISPFAELKDLEFIEMNVNRVESAEPLRNLTKLKYINLYSSKAVTDLSPLYNHSELRLCIFHRTVEYYEQVRFKKSNPDCETYYTVDSVKVTTNKAWRGNPYRIRLKTAFTNWVNVIGFNEQTGEYIFDYYTDQYKYI